MIEMENISIHAWIQKHGIKNEQGIPLDFRDHLFLFDIYSDNSPKLVCYKAAQVGFSTMAILKSIWLAKMKRMDIIYTMPSSSDMKDFVGGKINRIINQNPVLLDYVKDKDSIEQKQIDESLIYYRGTWTEKAAIAVSSDLNIHDEEDRSKQEVIQQYASRLQHSRLKYSWHFSNPSVEGNGVSRYWGRSDQKHWFITCGSCRKEQFLQWPDSVSMEKRAFVCKDCGIELTREDRRIGRWVKKYKDREYSGYWISLLMAPWITAEEIINYYETKSAEYFANFVLGLPYVGEGNQVTPDIIYRNCTPEVNQQDRVVIGCDSGLKKHYVVGNKDGIFYAGIATDWKDIEDLLAKYERSVAVIDALPDLTEPRRLREKYPGRVFLCHYARDRKTFQLIRWGKNEEAGNVTVDRNRMMQMVIDDFANKKIPLQGSISDWEPFQEHFATLYKTTVLDTLGVPVSVWNTSNGMDHFCFIRGTKIETYHGSQNIEDIKVGDQVLTRYGYNRVYDAGLKRERQRVVTAYFSDGSSFTATPDHPVITTEGKIRLDCLTRHAILYSCKNQKQKSLYTKVLLTGDTRKVIDGKRVFTSFLMEQKEKKERKGFINRCGLMPMVLFLKGLLFIIKTTIHSITTLQTWCVNHVLFIKDIMQERTLNQALTEEEIVNIWRGLEVNLTRGAKHPKVSSGIVNRLIEVLCWVNPYFLRALSAVLRVVHGALEGLSSVQSPVHLVGLHENIEQKDVINLSVEESHEYFANGILVSNCHATLYWRTGMDRFKNDGGKIFTGQPSEFKTAPTMLANDTMPWEPQFIYPAKEEDYDN